MHPILGRVDRLAAYLGAWVSVCVFVAGIFTRLGLSWVEALVLLVPLFLIYAFVCLSAWYVCRAVPLVASGRWTAAVSQSQLCPVGPHRKWHSMTS